MNNKDHYRKHYSKTNWRERFWFCYRLRKGNFRGFIKEKLDQLENLKIFEHGFGDGKLLLSFPRNNELYGTEIVDTAIRLVEPKCAAYKHCDLRIIEEEKIPFPTGSFDLTICSHVLEHIPNDEKTIKELKRVTKKGKYLIIVIPINEPSGYNPLHVREYVTKDFLILMNKNGLKIRAFTEYDYFGKLYNLWYYCNVTEGRVPLYVKLYSFFINIILISLPFFLIKLLDTIFEYFGVRPHQLIVMLENE